MHSKNLLVLVTLAATGLSFRRHQNYHSHPSRDLLGSSGQDLSTATQDLLQSVEEALSLLTPFDPTTTPVDVSGVHAFQPPVKGDERGPCPGLNSLANHGYIPRDGIVSVPEAVAAIHQVFGMDVDLALPLALMGLIWTGDPLSLDPEFSIGGKDDRVWNVLNNLLGLLGKPEGLDRSHNFIESDSSPTRDDLYVTGNAWTMNLSRFEEMYNFVPADQSISKDEMASYAAQRFQESVKTNPYFYYGPFTGMIARNAGYLFAVNLFANYSGGNALEGELTHDILESIFGVTSNANGNMKYLEGHERLPENWYRRPVDYGLAQLNLDVVDWVTKYPELGSIGGNTDGVNTFTGIDLTNATTGVLNGVDLLEGNNLLCFALEVVKLASPSYLSNLYSTLATPLALLGDVVGPLLSLDCPVWNDLTYDGKPLWVALEKDFPGATKSGRAL